MYITHYHLEFRREAKTIEKLYDIMTIKKKYIYIIWSKKKIYIKSLIWFLEKIQFQTMLHSQNAYSWFFSWLFLACMTFFRHQKTWNTMHKLYGLLLWKLNFFALLRSLKASVPIIATAWKKNNSILQRVFYAPQKKAQRWQYSHFFNLAQPQQVSEVSAQTLKTQPL